MFLCRFRVQIKYLPTFGDRDCPLSVSQPGSNQATSGSAVLFTGLPIGTPIHNFIIDPHSEHILTRRGSALESWIVVKPQSQTQRFVCGTCGYFSFIVVIVIDWPRDVFEYSVSILLAFRSIGPFQSPTAGFGPNGFGFDFDRAHVAVARHGGPGLLKCPNQ